jgi:arsenate reductase
MGTDIDEPHSGRRPGQRQVDWALPDPAGLTVEQIRPIRADIDGRVPRLLADLLAVRRPEEDR